MPAWASRRLLARWTAVMLTVMAGLLVLATVTPGSVLAGNVGPSAAGVALCVVVAAVALVADAAVGYFARIVDTRPGGDALLLLLVWPTLLVTFYLRRRYVAGQLVAVTTVVVVVFHDLPPAVALLQCGVAASSLTVLVLVVWHLRCQLTAMLAQSRTDAATDALTGLANRRGLEQHLPALWAAAARRGDDLDVLVIDLDRFLSIAVNP